MISAEFFYEDPKSESHSLEYRGDDNTEYSDGIRHITRLLQRKTRRMSRNTVRHLAKVQSLQRNQILCLVRRRQVIK